ncbi:MULTISPECIES: transglycosylase SLT domain-containing protein [unclassified Halobacteriovorax]|uniref:lytic transglycosylase domain-containing protein n=1 Tax=unclassified Halobacteriovorax TaxID=2639665 RepID=UPI00399BF26B
MRFTLLTIFILALSCTNLSRPPKTKPQDGALTNLLSKISKNNSVSCNEYQKFLHTQFPLSPWLRANYHKNCTKSIQELSEEYKNTEAYPYWAREELIDAIISKTYYTDVYASAVLNKVDYLNTKGEVERLLLDAMKKFEDGSQQQERIYQKLIDVSPRFIKEPERENYLDVAKSFEQDRQFVKAREYYKKIIRDKDTVKEEKVEAWFRLANSYKRERKNDSFRDNIRSLVLYLQKNRESQELKEKHAEYTIRLARIYWTEDKLQRAVRVLRNLLLFKEVPTEYVVTTYYTIGGIFEDLRKYDRSIKFYKKAYAAVEGKHEHLESIVWNVAWTNYKAGNYEEMIQWFDRFEEKNDEPNYRFLYWKFVGLKKLNRFDEAQKLLLRIQKEDQFGYYGQIAHMNHTKLKHIDYREKFDISIDELAWAVYLGNTDLAKKIIDSNDKVSFSDLYAAKYYNIMIFKFFREDSKTQEKILKDDPQFAFPLAFKKEFLENNRSKTVTTPLLMSIARQESAFNQYARSPADAFGLLQLIPEQGKRLSRRYKIPYEGYEDLYNPNINITFSSLLLNELMKRRDNNFIDFVASYNAGGTPIKRWRSRIILPDLEFIEEIPYKETRKYVKLVARNYLIYSRLLSNEPLTLKENFFRGGFIDMTH